MISNIADLDLLQAAAPQFAVDSQVEQRTIAHPLMLLKVEPHDALVYRPAQERRDADRAL